jgi:hypothetical protein
MNGPQPTATGYHGSFMNLVNPEVSSLLSSLPYAGGHGATSESLGGGIVYYAITSLARARVCVCLGSGGGFVPSLMRQAQRDLRIDNAVTYLVDAILPEAGYGHPEVPGGWLDEEGVFASLFAEVTILNCLTMEAGKGFFSKNRITIDYLHVDADHAYEAALADFETYLPRLSPAAFVTFHDSGTEPIQRVLAKIRKTRPEFDCLDMPELGAGLAILRRNPRRSR